MTSSLTLHNLLLKINYMKLLKEFKFQQNLQMEFTKNDKVLKHKIFIDPWFDSEKIEYNYINIDELSDINHNQLSSIVGWWTCKGSGWTINLIIKHQLVIPEITPCEGSSYFPLPKELRNPMKV